MTDAPRVWDSHHVLNCLSDGVIVAGLDGCIKRMNVSASELTGVRVTDAIGRPLEEIYRVRGPHEDARSTARGILRGEGDQCSAADLELMTRDGRTVPIEESCSPIRGDDGKVTAVVVAFRDDSARRLWERELEVSRAFRSAIVDAALDAIISIDRNGRLLDFNPAAERLFGVEREDVVGKLASETIVPPELRDGHVAALGRYDGTGTSPIVGRRIETVGLRADGTRVPVELAVTKSGHGRRLVFTGFLRDLTKQREEAERLDSELRQAAFERDAGRAIYSRGAIKELLDRCADAMVTHLEADLAVIWIRVPNRSNLSIYAHRSANGVHALSEADERALLDHAVLVDDAGEPKRTKDLRALGADVAERMPFEVSSFAGYPMIVEDRVIGVIALYARKPLRSTVLKAVQASAHGIGLGVVHRRALNTLRRQAKSLREADERKDQFLAMLAHELRNPLNPLTTGLGLLAQHHPDDERIEMMKTQVAHLARLVDDLLDVSRITRQRITLRRERCELRSIVEQAIHQTRLNLGELGHELETRLSDEEVWLEADPVRITQVVGNLLANAAKYTAPGGRIAVMVFRQHREAIVEVVDNGIGFESDFAKHAFDLFAQADRTLSRSQGGLGIGLTLVRHLVEQHGGSVNIHSPGPSRGTTVRVTLPLAEAPVAPAEDHDARPPVADTARRVLVVDDNQDSAIMVREVILALGDHEVELADDGPSALEKAAEWTPDLVLLDIGLPGLNGYEVVVRLRRDVGLKDARIVAVTGYSAEEHRRQSEGAGFDEHIVKPITVETIARLLAE